MRGHLGTSPDLGSTDLVWREEIPSPLPSAGSSGANDLTFLELSFAGCKWGQWSLRCLTKGWEESEECEGSRRR